jgi:hypothetical protein
VLLREGLERAVLKEEEHKQMKPARKIYRRRTPNFDEVSMNLSVTFSRSRREVWTMSDLRMVTTRFFVPGMEPLSIR